MRKSDKNCGLSLIELITTIAVLAILTAMLAPLITKYIEKSRKAKMMQKLDAFYDALSTSYVDALEESDENNIIDGDSITISLGKPGQGNGNKGDIDYKICEYMEQIVGDEEFSKINIYITRERVTVSPGNYLYPDKYSLKNLSIRYFPDTENLNHYFYYHKGSIVDETYGYIGEVNSGAITKWKDIY